VASTWTDSFDITVGTSFSSPLVAAVAGLMLSQQPALTRPQLLAFLQSTARPFPQSGADNGPDDPTPVTQCTAPASGVQQLQCYCSTALCGAGMMDAGAAMAATALGVHAAITVSPQAPVSASAVELGSANSFAVGGRTITAVSWSLVDGGGIVAGLSSTSASTSVTPSGAGTFRVRLSVTDSSGASASSERSITVAAASGGGSGGASGGGDGGGGAMSVLWLLLLGAAVAALHRISAARRA
jgi:serine protease